METGNVKLHFLAKGSISIHRYDNTTSLSRHLSGELRKKTINAVSKVSPINYHYQQFNNPENILVEKHGNFNKLHSQDVLRKVKSDTLSRDRLSCDMWVDIVSTKRLMILQLTVECLTVPLWYKQQVTFLNPKFN